MTSKIKGSNAGLIKHMSYECPVDRQIDVRPMTVGELLHQRQQIVIPIFQRRYCWKRNQVDKWWKDLIHSAGNFQVGHRIGRLLFAKEQTNELLCIDGQQRLTTTFLLLASVRDALLDILQPYQQYQSSEHHQQAEELIRRIERVLYYSERDTHEANDIWSADVIKECQRFLQDNPDNYEIPEGTAFKSLRILHSYTDRASFAYLITAKRVLLQPRLVKLNTALATLRQKCRGEDHMFTTKEAFDKHVQSYMQMNKNRPVKAMEFLVNRSLEHFSIMYTQCQEGVDLPQLFLWIQEKTLLSMGALLYNPAPGLPFALSDLVRNLVLSTLSAQTQQQQEEFYTSRWIPLQESFADTEKFDDFLSSFVERNRLEKSNLEETMEMIMASLQVNGSKRNGVIRYARFVTFFQNRANNMTHKVEYLAPKLLQELKEARYADAKSSMGPPRPIQ